MKKVLVFPCGSEIGLEIHRALKDSKHFKLYGASSVPDHGEAVFQNYIPDVLPVNHPGFITDISVICDLHKIDYIFPAHDDVLLALTEHRDKLSAEVIAPDVETVKVCRFKAETYKVFPEISPKVFPKNQMPTAGLYPVFVKPNRGQGSAGCVKVNNPNEWAMATKGPDFLTVENLPGAEFTVDCFTDRFGKLRFCEGRVRGRVKMGISVGTRRVEHLRFNEIAEFITSRLQMQGQWFFQVKEDRNGELKLLEIAPRAAGSSGLWRAYGINLPETTLLDRMLDSEIPVRRFRLDKGIQVEMSRALDTCFLYMRQ